MNDDLPVASTTLQKNARFGAHCFWRPDCVKYQRSRECNSVEIEPSRQRLNHKPYEIKYGRVNSLDLDMISDSASVTALK
jgi:hypothetical protein